MSDAATQRSKILIAFGKFAKPDFPVPKGVEIILYDRFGGAVDYGIIDDIVNKLASSCQLMEKSPVSVFQNIPLFNRELTAASNIYQRVFIAGNTMPDMNLIYKDAPYFPKTVSGVYIPEQANVFINENETPFVKGMEMKYLDLFRTKSRLSELASELAKLPVPGRTLRLYILLTVAS